MNCVLKFICDHFQVIGSAVGLFCYVAISNMPKPGVKWTGEVLYTWFYDTLQTVLPINRGKQLQLPPVEESQKVNSIGTRFGVKTT